MISGIYSITNLKDDKLYYGSSININKRWNDHKSNLRKNKHKNPYLQYAWNKYGEDSFEFKIEQITTKDNTLAIEQYYLDWIKQAPEQFYNVSYHASNPMIGKNHTNATKQKIGLASSKSIRTKEWLANMSEGHKDKTIYSFKNRKTNEVFIGIQHDFKKKHNLHDSQISRLLKGKRPSCRDWVLS